MIFNLNPILKIYFLCDADNSGGILSMMIFNIFSFFEYMAKSRADMPLLAVRVVLALYSRSKLTILE